MIPVTLPATALEFDSSPMTIELSASASLRSLSLVPAPGAAAPALVADFIESVSRGLPIDRPEGLIRLAGEVASRPPGLPGNWAADLAADFARFND
jgi:hypothetical protein